MGPPFIIKLLHDGSHILCHEVLINNRWKCFLLYQKSTLGLSFRFLISKLGSLTQWCATQSAGRWLLCKMLRCFLFAIWVWQCSHIKRMFYAVWNFSTSLEFCLFCQIKPFIHATNLYTKFDFQSGLKLKLCEKYTMLVEVDLIQWYVCPLRYRRLKEFGQG